ncbi:MAG: hypothetical protein OXC19_06540 [Bryobacterales bacterium]|nr:hypothetical protein [Bryobacterales bacterium]
MIRIRFQASVAAAGLLLASAALTQEPAPRPVATITQLMQAMIIPASNALFNVPRQVPGDDAGWDAVRNQAVILAESGNLLMVGDRAGDSGVWMETSRALTDAGEAALAAALARDVDAITSVGDQIIDACERCHEKHWIR